MEEAVADIRYIRKSCLTSERPPGPASRSGRRMRWWWSPAGDAPAGRGLWFVALLASRGHGASSQCRRALAEMSVVSGSACPSHSLSRARGKHLSWWQSRACSFRPRTAPGTKAAPHTGPRHPGSARKAAPLPAPRVPPAGPGLARPMLSNDRSSTVPTRQESHGHTGRTTLLHHTCGADSGS